MHKLQYGKKDLIAIEVKSGSKTQSKDLTGLLEFKKDYPTSKLYFIYAGQTKKVGDVQYLNIENFLLNLTK